LNIARMGCAEPNENLNAAHPARGGLVLSNSERAKQGEYFIEQRKDGDWQVKLLHAERASAIEATQREAIERARQFAPEGVIHVKQTNGKFRKV
jgi:Uncharacterized protein conserved in bacteria (DUF2188)